MSSHLSLAPLPAGNAPPRVPRLYDEVIGWVPEANDDHLVDVGAKEVRGARRGIGPEDRRFALGVGNLLDAAGQLRVARPVRRVCRSAVQREAGVAPEVERLQRPPHTTEPQLSVGENNFSSADTRGAVMPECCEGLVDVSIQETASQGGELRGLSFNITPSSHGKRMIPEDGTQRSGCFPVLAYNDSKG